MTLLVRFTTKPMMIRPLSSVPWGATSRRQIHPQQERFHHHHSFEKSFGSSKKKGHCYSMTTNTIIPQSLMRIRHGNRQQQQRKRFSPLSSSSSSLSLGVSLLHDLSSRIAQQQQQQHSLLRKSSPSISSSTTTSDTITTKKLASKFCVHYQSLPPLNLSSQEEAGKQREEILNYLIENCNVNFTSLSNILRQSHDNHNKNNIEQQEEDNVQFYAKIREACTPLYEDIFSLLAVATAQTSPDSNNDNSIGIKCILSIRQDLKTWELKLKQLSHLHHISSFKEKENEKEEEEGRVKKKLKIKQMNMDIKNMLSVWFSSGMLELRRITYDTTPASIIEQIALKEAVHPLRNLNDLRTRLGRNRRCYAFFHPSFLVNEPLVFVHVALMQDIPCSMEDIDTFTMSSSDKVTVEEKECKEKKVAVFYSITSTQPGLSGVDLGNFLIKRVVDVLKRDFPKMETFITLSPLPRFRKWVEGKLKQQQKQSTDGNDVYCGTKSKFIDDTLFTQEELHNLEKVLQCSFTESVPSALIETLENPQWHENHDLSSILKPILLKLAARYLLQEKHRGKPLDGVAKFHIRNGAEMYQLNYLADKSRKGMHNSFGIMINYRYCLEPEGVLENNQLRYETDGWIEVGERVLCWLDNDGGDNNQIGR